MPSSTRVAMFERAVSWTSLGETGFAGLGAGDGAEDAALLVALASAGVAPGERACVDASWRSAAVMGCRRGIVTRP